MLEERINKERAWFRIWSYLFAGAVVLVFIFGVAGLVYLPWLRFKDIKVEGNIRTTSADIVRALTSAALNRPLAKYLGYTSMFLWGMDNPEVGTPLVASVNLERNWFNREIIVTVRERERYAAWCAAETSCVWIDSFGVALEAAPATDGQLVNMIYSASKEPVQLGEHVIEENKFIYFKKILDVIVSARIAVSRIEYDVMTYGVVVKTSAGARLLFSLRFDPGFTIAPFSSIADRKDFSRMDYVDFRIENRVYYK